MKRAALWVAWVLAFVAYWTDRGSSRLCRWGRCSAIFGRCGCYRGPGRRS